jgi:hypothetical protein
VILLLEVPLEYSVVNLGAGDLPFERELQLPMPLLVRVFLESPILDATAGEPPVQPDELNVYVMVSVAVPLLVSVSGGLNVIVPVMSEQLYVPVPILASEAAAARFGATMRVRSPTGSATARAPNMILRSIDPPSCLPDCLPAGISSSCSLVILWRARVHPMTFQQRFVTRSENDTPQSPGLTLFPL